MRILDTIKISQSNLLRAKLRTFLTVAAVFIGALTLSLTNGVGSGIKAYVHEQIGNVGVKDTLVVQMKQQLNPISTEVREYDPNRKIGGNFNIAMLGKNDIEKIKGIPGIINVIPEYAFRFEYITTGNGKYEANATQYVEGLTLAMSAGNTVSPNIPDAVTIPDKFVNPLGFSSDSDAVGKTLTVTFKDVSGKMIEKELRIVGVQKQSLLGSFGLNINSALAEEISVLQTKGVPGLADTYQGAIVKYNPNVDPKVLKQILDLIGYTGRTLEDQIGTIGKVIDAILVVLNVFGIITLLAATFGIVNTLLMSVNERISEIGLMKALGARRRTIFSIFALEAASIGFWGALLGVLVSIGIGTLASNIAAESFLKSFVGFELATFPIVSSLVVLFGIVALAFIAGALPSLKASKLDPIKALRYE